MDRHFDRMERAVLVPVKAFSRAKLRLAPALDPASRAALARTMAARVLAAAAPLATAVVCDDEEVAGWAARRGAEVVWARGMGLDRAVAEGVARLGGQGFDRVVVAHGDLPMARRLAALAAGTGVTLVPDRRGDGTNVAVVPPAAGFGFAYGPGSFGRHCAEAQRLALPLRVVQAPELAWDVDVPADLELPSPLTPAWS